ncbi:dihydroneopterin aldolase [Ectothiorhodospiraceae bacterium WFHF3C12]|nr:dihydroneopterin aldolase [Ectothiorhodospiraceae bacterium WFHF3C12]
MSQPSGEITVQPAVITVKALRLRAYVGFNDEEQHKLQDVVLNLHISHQLHPAVREDQVEHALNYKTITKEVIALVDGNRFLLLEKLVNDVVESIISHEQVKSVTVEADKPHALRFADSVSVSLTATR